MAPTKQGVTRRITGDDIFPVCGDYYARTYEALFPHGLVLTAEAPPGRAACALLLAWGQDIDQIAISALTASEWRVYTTMMRNEKARRREAVAAAQARIREADHGENTEFARVLLAHATAAYTEQGLLVLWAIATGGRTAPEALSAARAALAVADTPPATHTIQRVFCPVGHHITDIDPPREDTVALTQLPCSECIGGLWDDPEPDEDVGIENRVIVHTTTPLLGVHTHVDKEHLRTALRAYDTIASGGEQIATACALLTELLAAVDDPADYGRALIRAHEGIAKVRTLLGGALPRVA